MCMASNYVVCMALICYLTKCVTFIYVLLHTPVFIPGMAVGGARIWFIEIESVCLCVCVCVYLSILYVCLYTLT